MSYPPGHLDQIARFHQYDLSQDPLEKRNIADQHPEVATGLESVLWNWLESSYYEGSDRETRRGEISPETEEALRALGYIE